MPRVIETERIIAYPWRYGWCFTLVWAFSVFYTRGIGGYTGMASIGAAQDWWPMRLYYSGLPTLMCILALVVLVALEQKIGGFTEIRIMSFSAPVFSALSTPLLFLSFDDPGMQAFSFFVGSLITGISSSALWLMWGKYYASIAQENAESYAPVSAVVAAVLLLCVSTTTGIVCTIAVSILPLLSGFCFILSWRELDSADIQKRANLKSAHVQSRTALHSFASALRHIGRTGLGLLVVCVFWTLGLFLWDNAQSSLSTLQAAIAASIVFTAIVAFLSVAGPRKISIPSLYRWMCPCLVVAYISFCLAQSPTGEAAALVALIAARFAFCLIILLYFAQLAVHGSLTAFQSFGLGKLFVNIGDLMGICAAVLVSYGISQNWFSFQQCALVCIGVFFIATIFVLGDKTSFMVSIPRQTSEGHPAGSQGAADPNKTGYALADSATEMPDSFCQSISVLAQKHCLTPRETEVFDLLARGRSVPYIRDALCISRQTAATHAKRIYSKMDVHSKQELIDLVNNDKDR